MTELKPCPFCGKSDKLKFMPATYYVASYNWRNDAMMPYTPGRIVCSRCDVTMEGPFVEGYKAADAQDPYSYVTTLRSKTTAENVAESDEWLIKLWNMRRKENDVEIHS